MDLPRLLCLSKYDSVNKVIRRICELLATMCVPLDFITLVCIYASHAPYINMCIPCAIIVPGPEVILSPFPAFVYLVGNMDNIRVLHR